jgi:hypothetical protein
MLLFVGESQYVFQYILYLFPFFFLTLTFSLFSFVVFLLGSTSCPSTMAPHDFSKAQPQQKPASAKGQSKKTSELATNRAVLVDHLNQLSPTPLPYPRSNDSESTLQAFNDSVSKGTNMDFTVLIEERCLECLKFFSNTVIKLTN